ncbi:hypothetical protein B1B_15621, partial [mine drainage metagenome]
KEEAIEDSIKATIDDVARAISLTKPKDSENGPKSVRIILASDWKCKAYNALCKERTMEKVLSNKEFASVEKQELAKFLSKYMKGLNSIKPIPEISQKEMNTAFTEAKKFMESKIGCSVEIESESESDSKRASRAETLKPSIDAVWA